MKLREAVCHQMRKIVISHSRMATFYGCQSAYKFAHYFPQPDIRDISSDGMTSFPMDVGSAMHLAMQDFMKNGDYDRAVFTLWRNYPFALYERGLNDGGRTIFAALSAFNNWVDARPRDFYSLVHVDGKPSDELVMEIALGSIGDLQFVYQLHIDFVMQRETDGLIIPIDVKTYRGEDKLARYQYSLQLIPYMLGINMMLGRPAPLEFVGEYWFLDIVLTDPQFKTMEVRKTDEHFQYWLASVQQVCRAIYDNVTTGRWPRNENHCVAFGQTCRWAEHCWSRSTDAELDEWFTSLAEGYKLRNDETPAFSFAMEVL